MDSQVTVPRRLLKFVLLAYAAMTGAAVYAIKELIPFESPVVRWTAGFVMGFTFLAPALRLWEASRGNRPLSAGRFSLALVQGSVVVAFLAWVWLVVTR
jgi:hypothetical protein